MVSAWIFWAGKLEEWFFEKETEARLIGKIENGKAQKGWWDKKNYGFQPTREDCIEARRQKLLKDKANYEEYLESINRELVRLNDV